MASPTWVKVVGFSDAERHSLNTMFRLSEHLTPAYMLWTPETPSQPHVALIDVDSYEGGPELPAFRTTRVLDILSCQVSCSGSNSAQRKPRPKHPSDTR